MRSALHRWLVERGGGVFLACLVAYGALAFPHIVDGDNAEFASLSALGGAAHPSGYPAYVLWLRAWSWLPAASPAHAAALATAILAALAAWFAFLAARAWGARPLAAAFAAGLYAAAPTVLRLATEAEIFAWNQAVCAAIVWLAAAAGPLRGGRRAAVLGLVAGLGLAGHMTCGLIAPVGLLGVVRGIREARRGWIAAAAALAGFAVGLSPYLYLFVAPDTPASWGHVDSWDALVAHVSRRAYGGPTALTAHSVPAPLSAQLVALGRTLGRAWWWIPLVGGLGALGYRCLRPGEGEPRAGWIALAACWLVAGPVLVSRFNTSPAGANLFELQRFYVLPTLLLVPAVAWAVDRLFARASARFATALPVLAAVAAVAALARSLPDLAERHTPAHELVLRDVLDSLPPDACVITIGTGFLFGFTYLQFVDGVRPDVLPVTWTMVGVGWYRDRLARRGFELESGDGAASLRAAEAQLARGRPVFVDDFEGNILRVLPSYRYGAFYRVLPRGTTPPPPAQVFAENAALFDRWQRDGAHDDAPPRAGQELAGAIYSSFAETWTIISDQLARAGDGERAQQALVNAERFGPSP